MDLVFIIRKYEFNEGSVNDDKTSFSFSSADRETTLNVYKEYNPGNAKDKAREFYDSVDNNSEYNITYHHGSNEYRVMGGPVTSYTNRSFYFIIKNDGTYDYIVKYIYYDDDVSNEKNQQDYLMESIYRGCSFSGHSKDIRTCKGFMIDKEIY